MKVILGSPESGKSTVLLHYVYNQIAELIDSEKDKKHHACVITSKKKLVESKMIFGIYCEVSIETLREVKMKYIEDYDELVHFLADFHLLPQKPSILAIDSLEYFVDPKKSNMNLVTRQMRQAFLMTLLKDCQAYLEPSLYRHSSLIVSYKLGFESPVYGPLLASIGKRAEGVAVALAESFSKLDDKARQQVLKQVEVDVQRTLQDFGRHTNQIFYLSRDKVSTVHDAYVLSLQQRQLLPDKYIELCQLVSAFK